MDMMIMSAGIALVIVFGIAAVVGFAEGVKEQKSERLAPQQKQSETKPLNEKVRGEINEILGRCGGEEQLL